MIPIDEPYVDGSAPNANAIKNGRGQIAQRENVGIDMRLALMSFYGRCDAEETD